MDTNIERKYLPSSLGRVLFAHLIDFLFILISSILIVFLIIYPISQTGPYGEKSKLLEVDRNAVIEILEASKLTEYNEETKVLANENGIYRSFVLKQIKYSYEMDIEIKTLLDEWGYASHMENGQEIPLDSYENNYLGYFYTEYIIGKKDKENQLVVNYTKEESFSYFQKEVLKIGEKNYFISNPLDEKELPHLEKQTCLYLFQYFLTNTTFSTLRNFESEFFLFFHEAYQNAGNLLLKYSDYEIAYSNYGESYNYIQIYKINSNIAAFLLTTLVFLIIIPLTNRQQKTLGNFISKTLVLNQLQETKKKRAMLYHALTSVYMFLTIPILLIISGGLDLLNFTIFRFGIFTINLWHISILVLFFLIINIFINVLSVKKQGAFSHLVHMSYYD